MVDQPVAVHVAGGLDVDAAFAIGDWVYCRTGRFKLIQRLKTDAWDREVLKHGARGVVEKITMIKGTAVISYQVNFFDNDHGYLHSCDEKEVNTAAAPPAL